MINPNSDCNKDASEQEEMLNSRLKSRLQTALESKMSRYYGVTVSEATPEIGRAHV